MAADDKTLIEAGADTLKKLSGVLTDMSKENVFGDVAKGAMDFATALNKSGKEVAGITAALGGLAAETAFLENGIGGLLKGIGGGTGILAKFGAAVGYIEAPTLRVTNAQMEAAIAFNKVSNVAGIYDNMVSDLQFSLREFGVQGGETANVLNTMYSGFTDLSIGGITPTEKRLLGAAAILGEFGVPVDNTVGAMQSLRKSFLMSDEQIEQAVFGLKSFAMESGMTAAEVIGNFQAQAPVFARFGDDGVRTFKQLQAAAKSTGLGIDEMISITDKFNRFDTAAESVGNLNALLQGPYLNAVDLVKETDPTKRMMMLKQAFDEAGLSVQDMGYYQKLAFSEAMGLGTDVEKLVKTLEGDYGLLTEAVGATAESQSEMSAQLATTRTAKENREVIEDTVLAVDGLAKAFLHVNETSFPIAIKKGDDLRKKLSEGVGPAIAKIGDTISTTIFKPLNLGTEGLTATAKAAVNERATVERQNIAAIKDLTSALRGTDPGTVSGQPLVVQVMLDDRGKKVLTNLAVEGVRASIAGGP